MATIPAQPPRPAFRAHQAAGVLVLLAAIWMSSGTMAPYGATLASPKVLPPCDYLANIDHIYFEQTFMMLNGAPKAEWKTSFMLRRILFPVLSYPLMKVTTFEIGGFLTSLIVNAIAFLIFTTWLRRRAGDSGAKAVLWLLATYPGITYWAALPYAYAVLVPFCLVGFILLTELSESTEPKRILGCCLGLGILFMGYDLWPYMVPAVVAVMISRKQVALLPAALALMFGPSVVWTIGVLGFLMRINPVNANTGLYLTVARSYLSHPDLRAWAALLARFPIETVRVYFYSNLLFLPAMFTVYWIASRRTQVSLSKAEGYYLLAIVAVYLFNNLAPPYPDMQIRGSSIARLYQPAFVAMLVFSARYIQSVRTQPAWTWTRAALVITVLLNASVVFGIAVDNPLSAFLYMKFYAHGNADPRNVPNNLATYGHRPIGFCAPPDRTPG